jgi:hypothetical protein
MERERLLVEDRTERAQPRERPPGVRKNGLVGDTAARRIKGDVGTETKQYRVFRSLALYGLGDVSYGDLGDPVFSGQLEKLDDWVECIPLTDSAHQRLLDTNLSVYYELGTMKSPENYTNVGNEGRRLPFDNGEYVSFEKGDGFYSVSWTCALALQPAVDALLTCAGSAYEPSEGGLVERDEWVQGPAREMLGHIRKRYAKISFARLSGERLAIAWRSDAGASEDGKVKLHECFVVCSVDDRELLGNLLRETGTPSVGASSDEVVSQLDDLLQDYPASSA